MKTFLETIKSLGSVNASITTTTSREVFISVKPNTVGLKDDALKNLKPFVMTVNPMDTEEEVCKLIEKYVPQAVEVVDSIREYEESVAKTDAEKKAAKAEKEKKEKAEAEMKKDFEAFKSLLNSVKDGNEQKDETRHQMRLVDLKKHKDIKGYDKLFSDVQTLFNDIYVSLDLFSQG